MLEQSLASLSRFWLNFNNPLHVLLKRHFIKKGMMTVVDRHTGICCECTIGSHRMFGETWHDKDYDVPHMPLRKDDIVIDVGANQGFFTCYAAHKGAKVYAFEPFMDSFQTLIANLKINQLDSHVVAKNWAIGGENGFTELMCFDELGGCMNTTQAEFAKNAGLQAVKTNKVPCFTLPHLIEEFCLDKIRLCKLDCEGSELDILKQLKPAHWNKIESFVIEYHPQAYSLSEIMELLLSWGTHQVSLAEDKYIPRQILRVVANTELKLS